jgi:BASS family bile acid:Na+ symporter
MTVLQAVKEIMLSSWLVLLFTPPVVSGFAYRIPYLVSLPANDIKELPDTPVPDLAEDASITIGDVVHHAPAFTFPFKSNGVQAPMHDLTQDLASNSTTVASIPPPMPESSVSSGLVQHHPPSIFAPSAVGSYLSTLQTGVVGTEGVLSSSTPTLRLNYLETMLPLPASSAINGTNASVRTYVDNLNTEEEQERSPSTTTPKSYLDNLSKNVVPSKQDKTESRQIAISNNKSVKLNTILSNLTSGFPFFVLSAAVLGFKRPSALMWVNKGELIPIMLATVMLTMGSTLQTKDFTSIISTKKEGDKDASSIKAIPAGILSQFIIMPAVAFLVANALLLPAIPSAFLGLVLVGCSPGGAASNLVSFIARADVALSVMLTTISTILTPLLVRCIAGSSGLSISGLALGKATAKAVLLPLAAGILIREKTPKIANIMGKFAPVLGVSLVSLLCGGVVAQNAAMILAGGLTKGPMMKIIMAVLGFHSIGFMTGYFASKKVFGLSEKASRTVSIESGMKSSAVAIVLARSIFTNMSGVSSSVVSMACLPGAISAVVHSCLGSALAVYWRLMDSKKENNKS